jgi:hypothetical protein
VLHEDVTQTCLYCAAISFARMQENLLVFSRITNLVFLGCVHDVYKMCMMSAYFKGTQAVKKLLL